MTGSARYDRIVSTLSRRQPDLSVAMENVHKTRNLGAVARTCDAVGIGEVHAVAPDDERVRLGHKSASGTEKWIHVRRHASTAAAYAYFRSRGLRIVAADVGDGARDFRTVDYTVPTVVVIGSELDGLSVLAREHAALCVRIPLMGMTRSLNVSVATGIILYEAAGQRERAGMYRRRRIDDEEYARLLFEWLHPGIARHCRKHGRRYPALDADGEIRNALTPERRAGIAGIAR